MHILLVEAHEDSATAVKRLLKSRGHKVTWTASAAEALARCADARFDLLISEIALPKVDGWELMRECRRLYGMRGIAVSASVFGPDHQASQNAGFLLHLDKPIDAAELLAAIDTIVMTLPEGGA
jgi:CheY-like chemotaxis protein